MTEIINTRGQRVADYRSPVARAFTDLADVMMFGESTTSMMATAQAVNRRIEQRRREFYSRRARRMDIFFSIIMTLAIILVATIALLPIIWVSVR